MARPDKIAGAGPDIPASERAAVSDRSTLALAPNLFHAVSTNAHRGAPSTRTVARHSFVASGGVRPLTSGKWNARTSAGWSGQWVSLSAKQCRPSGVIGTAPRW
ncbi:hypothetical protein NWFMUON74_11410 [Nocardia wallacei]|uniref:Uncharacterized protein n=1 Tax=Nocardia wallacei TaxID=480035 RepID=A0A7G1KHB4_9NOCA|nr:hypothetical protein NWFMUON74_11410 [Nocardia wallacei]